MISSTFKKAFLSFALLSLISSTGAQVASCDISSPDCCWVVRIWQMMGQRTTVSSTHPTACCSMSGVVCSESSVIKIQWRNKNITGPIPEDIGKFKNLLFL